MINIIMAETIWNGAVTVFDFIMDNLVIINVLLSLVIVFFQRRSSADGMDMAASALFYTDPGICPVSYHRAGLPQKQDV